MHNPLLIHFAQKCLIVVLFTVMADAREKGGLSTVNGVRLLRVAVLSATNLAHNRPFEIDCFFPYTYCLPLEQFR